MTKPMKWGRWIGAAALLVAVVGGLAARKYALHRRRIPLLSEDAATLASIRAMRVQIYTADWCYSCSQAEQFLQENEVPFDAHDIEKEPGAAQRAFELSKATAVPVIEARGKVMVGYEPHKVIALLESAAHAQ
jgi:glutaredoxin